MTDAQKNRISAAARALQLAREAMYADGCTNPLESEHTAKRRAGYDSRRKYLQAKDHFRQVSQVCG